MKADKRRARAAKPRNRGEATIRVAPGPALDPALEAPSMAEVMASLEQMPDPRDWPAAAPLITPIFQRVRPSPFADEEGELITVELPPGITVAFGIDLGMAFARVNRGMLNLWQRDVGTLVSRAMENLRRRAALITPDYVIHEPSDDGYVMKGLQPPGAWGSALLLVPDQLERLFGPEPQIFIAPMRALLMCFPADVDRATVAFFAEEFEAMDPNALRLEGFVLRDGRLTIEPLPRTDLAPVAEAQIS